MVPYWLFCEIHNLLLITNEPNIDKRVYNNCIETIYDCFTLVDLVEIKIIYYYVIIVIDLFVFGYAAVDYKLRGFISIFQVM